MATSIFDDKKVMPDDVSLGGALASAKELWDKGKSYAEKTAGELDCQWKFYSKSAGWSYVVKRKKRTLFYLVPKDSYFLAAFVYGEKAVTEALASDLPASVISEIQNARAYAEGRSFFTEIKAEEDLKVFEQLLQIKMEH